MSLAKKLALGAVGAVFWSARDSLETWRFHRRFVQQAQQFRDRSCAGSFCDHPSGSRDLPAPVQKYLSSRGRWQETDSFRPLPGQGGGPWIRR